MGTPLATPAQLAAFLGTTIAANDPTALLMLDIASDMVRDYLQQQITRTTETVIIDPGVGSYVLLPEMPVNSVSLVETTVDGTTWTTAATTGYNVSLTQGVIVAISGYSTTWPTGPGSWRVTYDHGYGTIPNSIIGAALGVAGRAYVSELGIDSERIGGYQVKYAMESDGFSSLETKALARYKFPRVA